MNIAEFFVSLGVKGSEKAVGAITSVSSGMSKLWNSSTSAKVAIIGVFYELEQLFAASNKTGSQLKEFSTVTGLSSQTLQQYQYAAQQVVGHNVELADTFKSLQDSIKNMMGPGGGGFQYLGAMVNALNKYSKGPKIELTEAKQWLTNIPLLVQRMQQFAALKQVATPWKEMILKQMGGGPDFIEALMLKGLTPDKLKAAKPFAYSEAEVNRLTRASTAWANMGTTMNMSVGRFNAQYGPQMAENIEKIVNALMGPHGLIPALTELGNQVKVFDLLNKGLIGLAHGIEGISKLPDIVKALKSVATGTWAPTIPKAPEGFHSFGFKEKGHTTNNITTNIHTNTTDPRQHGDTVGKHVKKAITQSPTLLQSN